MGLAANLWNALKAKSRVRREEEEEYKNTVQSAIKGESEKIKALCYLKGVQATLRENHKCKYVVVKCDPKYVEFARLAAKETSMKCQPLKNHSFVFRLVEDTDI